MAAAARVHGALELFRLGGFRLYVHFSVVAALPLFGWLSGQRMATLEPRLRLGGGVPLAGPGTWAVLFACGLLASVLWHEAAHALAARAVGARVDEITLVFLGGYTRADGIHSPLQRAFVAAAGPAASLALGLLLLQGAYRVPFAHLDARVAAASLAEVQLVLGVVDLLPVLPLDGGRLVAAMLEPRFGRLRATRVVARLGKWIAALVALQGTLTGRLLLIGLAAVLWAGTDWAARGARAVASLRGVRVRDLLAPLPRVGATSSLAMLLERMRSEQAPAYAVVDRGQLVGMVTPRDLTDVPRAERAAACVLDVSRPAVTVGIDRPGDEALAMMQAMRLGALAVVERGALVGVVTDRALAAAVEIGELGEPPAGK